MPKEHDRFSAVILLCLGFLMLLEIKTLPAEVKIFPITIAWGLILLSVILLWQSHKDIQCKKKLQEGREAYHNFPVITKRALFLFLISATGVLLIRIIGFYLSSVLFMLATAYYLKGIKIKTVLIATVVFNVFVYVVFTLRLNVPLPTGIF